MNKTILLTLLLSAFGLQAQMDTVSFAVDMNNYSGSFNTVNLNGDFNGWCGACNPMADPDMDGVWEVSLPLPANDSIEYKFTVDGWTDQENFVGGESCTKTSGGFTNRFLIYNGNTTLPTVCWNYCVDCASVPAAPSLPIDFESTSINYATSGFGELTDTIVVDPTDPNNMVWQHDKPANAQTWAGAIVGFGGMASPVPFTASETIMTMRVWSPDAGAEIRIKLEVAGNTSVSVETVDTTTVAGGWELLTFDFSNEVASTPALDTAADYNQVVVFPNFGVDGATAGAKTYYFDDIMFGVPMNQVDLPITFEDPMTDYYPVSFGDNSDSIQADPTDPTNTVMRLTKLASAQTWAGTVIGEDGLANPIPFSATHTLMTVRVWSPDAGASMLLKVEDANDGTIAVETSATTTVAGDWETLTFDFSNHAAGTPALDLTQTYNKVVFFPNFGVAGATAGEKTYYIDDIEFVANVGLEENSLNAFNIVPNPNNGLFRLQGDALNGNSEVKVVDMNGRLMFQSRVNTNDSEIDLRNLDNGVYLILIEADQKVYRQKMVLNR